MWLGSVFIIIQSLRRVHMQNEKDLTVFGLSLCLNSYSGLFKILSQKSYLIGLLGRWYLQDDGLCFVTREHDQYTRVCLCAELLLISEWDFFLMLSFASVWGIWLVLLKMFSSGRVTSGLCCYQQMQGFQEIEICLLPFFSLSVSEFFKCFGVRSCLWKWLWFSCNDMQVGVFMPLEVLQSGPEVYK